ncbi:MAG TPA: AsmA-like C-terminal region-containing protein [Steroidobacteraceae bacterium]|nr:AsmA-like C-terminal region-containing protein [Steroidobacteraceae bacterium]
MKSQLRLALVTLGSVLALLLTAVLAYQLAAARVPQQRAALEELIRHETGLEVSFSELSVRWGWHGPEAVFHDVELGEPGAGSALLRAPRLIVGLDPWRVVRSGELSAARIRLLNPDIDLGRARAGRAAAARATSPGAGALDAGRRILARWRGGRIDIEGGTLHAGGPDGAASATVAIRYAQLHHLGGEWSADALLLLPGSQGGSAHLSLRMHGDPALPEVTAGTLGFEGQRLEFAAWHALVQGLPFEPYLPRAGRGNLELHAAFDHGRVLSAAGEVQAQGLEWSTADGVLACERLRAAWQLARHGALWHLSVSAPEAGAPALTAAALELDAAADGAYVRGRLQHAPLAALAAIAHGVAPQLPLQQLSLAGEVRAASFDWSAQRPRGARLRATAELADISLGNASRELTLAGLSAHLELADASVLVDLGAPAARLLLTREQPLALEQLQLHALLRIAAAAGGWRVSAEQLQLRHAALNVAGSGALGAERPGAAVAVDAHFSLRDTDVALLAGLVGARMLGTLGLAGQLTAGSIERAELSWRGPWTDSPWLAPGTEFAGNAALREATLAAAGNWPDARDIAARIEWRGPRGHADIDHARSGSFELSAARADWDLGGLRPLRFSGRLAGNAAEALAWIRDHPQLAAWAPGIGDIDLRGATLIDLGVTLPAAMRSGAASRPRVRFAALLDGDELRPVAGLPPLAALRGALVFADGRLQRSALSGQWLGGPVSLAVGERREHGAQLLVISGRGVVTAAAALEAAGGSLPQAPLAGSAEWSALLSLQSAAVRVGASRDEQPAAQPRWQLRADSTLVGIASTLPDPLAKSAGAALPLHVELQGAGDVGQLRVNLGERLHALLALSRSADSWRIERGAVSLATATADPSGGAAQHAAPPAGEAPVLPVRAVLTIDGHMGRLDLPACLALWRQAGADAALPVLDAHLSAGQLLLGTRVYGGVRVLARAGGEGGELQLDAPELSLIARWPGAIDPDHPATVHLGSFSITQPEDVALSAGLATVLAPAVQLAIDDLRWQGRALGSLSARLAAQSGWLEVSALQLSGDSAQASGSVRCETSACRLQFSLDSTDAAATLTAFGMRPDASARRARLEGELRWSLRTNAPLATLGGHLHMQLEDGLAQAAPEAGGQPFALLSVPALIAGMSSAAGPGGQSGLHFASLNADYELHEGEAFTPDLHFDGDAEILVRGRVGLRAGDYDEEAWILHGEERLPAAVRRLGPTPRLAAAWLSLRELFAGTPTDRTRTALRLRGTWNDPIVAPAE